MKIYKLVHDTYTAEINLSRGANCISLRNTKYQATILREPDYSSSLDNPFLYGMPVLFPVNRISNAKFVFENREYRFPINEAETGCYLHGDLHQKHFQITECGEDYVVCSYKATKENPYIGFPHEFEIIISYYLTSSGLEQKTEIKNLSTENMPVMIGFHTTFALPFVDGQNLNDVKICAEVGDYIERSTDNYLPNGNIIVSDDITENLRRGEFSCNQKISRHYKCCDSGKMYIKDTKKNITILYENSMNFGFRLIFNGDADKFICLEPQNCVVDCMNSMFSKEYSGYEYVEPLQSKAYYSKISVVEID